MTPETTLEEVRAAWRGANAAPAGRITPFDSHGLCRVALLLGPALTTDPGESVRFVDVMLRAYKVRYPYVFCEATWQNQKIGEQVLPQELCSFR